MPSSIAHASVAVLSSPLLSPRWRTRRVIGLTAVAAALPDLDAIGRPFGRGDIDWLGGHRALTHSLFAALAIATLSLAFIGREAKPGERWRVFLFVLFVVASHGLLDAFSAYGEGVALFAPFTMYRWKSAWQPFGGLWSELFALWLPAALVYALWVNRETGKLGNRVIRLPGNRDTGKPELR
jgi:inner membrane protein